MAQARELLNMGLELRSKGDAAGALEKLEAAHALVRTPITGLELGRTYMSLGKLVEARETFLSNGRIPERPEETARSKAARKESDDLAEQLRSRIPSLSVKVTGVPSDTVAVTIDGASVPTEALSAPRLVDPGRHAISARSTSGGMAETSVDLKEGESRAVELKIVFAGGRTQSAAPPVAGAPAVLGPAPASASGSRAELVQPSAGTVSATPRSRALEWTLLVSGLAIGAGGAAAMVVEANRATDAANSHDKATYDSSNTAWTVGMVATIVGGAAFATGGIVFLATGGDSSPRGSRTSTWIGLGPGVVRIAGSW
jgi:hypothetical protein